MFCLLWKPLAPRRVRPEAAPTWVSGGDVPHGLGLQSCVSEEGSPRGLAAGPRDGSVS